VKKNIFSPNLINTQNQKWSVLQNSQFLAVPLPAIESKMLMACKLLLAIIPRPKVERLPKVIDENLKMLKYYNKPAE
jgi:hypothetical protein